MEKNKFYDVTLHFVKDFTGVLDQELERIEKRFTIIFPALIKEFYIKFNRGQFGEKQSFFNENIHLEALLEINGTGPLDFERSYDITLGNQFWPKKLVPFGYDAAGNDFCFSIATEDCGAIYFHMSEWTGEPEEVQFLAKDFLSFLKALRPESDFE